MVELVDTLVSGTSGGNAVQVRVLFWAPFLKSEDRNQKAELLFSNFLLQISNFEKRRGW